MVLRTDRCNGCYNCVIACKDEYVGNDHLPFSVAQPDTGHFWMRIVEQERGQFRHVVKVHFTPIPCLQCREAPCLESAADSGSVYALNSGVLIIDPVKARGRRELVESCPFGAIYWNEDRNVAQKCTLCTHLTEKGMLPRCVESCPTDAIVFGDLDDVHNEVSKLIASEETETLRPELGIDTAVRYTGLPGAFVAGSVVRGDTDECAAGAKVILSDGSVQRTSTTDSFGDFEVDGLSSAVAYRLSLELAGYSPKALEVNLKGDMYLGDIILERC